MLNIHITSITNKYNANNGYMKNCSFNAVKINVSKRRKKKIIHLSKCQLLKFIKFDDCIIPFVEFNFINHE